MNSIYRDIFRAIHEGKWLSIEYCNKEKNITKYWIGVKNLNIHNKSLSVEGLHMGLLSIGEYNKILIDSIISSKVVEGSYYPVNESLINDIYINPHKYTVLFDNVANLEILSYLEMCNKMDTIPYYKEFDLVKYLDRDKLSGKDYKLSEEQFQYIIKNFQYKLDKDKRNEKAVHMQQMAINVLSINSPKGLYVLAYRRLRLDIKNKSLRPDDEITICTEFTINGVKQSIRKYIDADEYELLNDFEKNQEQVKDCIIKHLKKNNGTVDDMPYIIGLGMDIAIDLHNEYKAIMDMHKNGKITVPIKAFFGDLLNRPRSKSPSPIALINQNVNMDQLLAINNAMKYPVSYVQGPPGTGKTNTIVNTIVTAYFNEKTVLFASYNNHPIDGVYEKLSRIKYRNNRIPFPILRLGNREKLKEALEHIKQLYEETKNVKVYEATLDKNKDDRKTRAKRLSELLKKYDELLDMKERKETITCLLEHSDKNANSMQMIPFQSDLGGRQLKQINRKIENSGNISEHEAMELLDKDIEELKKYLYYTSAKYIKKLETDKYEELRDIVFSNSQDKVEHFAKYIKEKENISKLQAIFPIIATTCISAQNIGMPEPVFDMTIIDEASQCNTAVALVPIIRGEKLMLVGDPQQLNPVILLNDMINEKLKKRYHISDEYDYKKSSIYKTYLSCDSVSDEILLHNHYRCNKKIIDFNNRKYYNSKLNVKTENKELEPLEYIDITDALTYYKNTSPAEAKEIVKYAAHNKDKTIGVITPFVSQKAMIEKELENAGIQNVTCGTVHAFQGDEKDVVLFSTAITDQTQLGTYTWLKNNKELINVATSRAKDKLIILGSKKNMDRLHNKCEDDDLYELVNYVTSNGKSVVTPKLNNSRALGIKPFSTDTENAFLKSLTHALENIWMTQSKYVIHKEVGIAHVFKDNYDYNDLFYSGRFDFVVYEKNGEIEVPILAIELDGKEHFQNEIVMERDKKKNEICKKHNMQVIRVENSYARRYNHIKEILTNYFSIMH